jgi:hypothetical protein
VTVGKTVWLGRKRVPWMASSSFGTAFQVTGSAVIQ